MFDNYHWLVLGPIIPFALYIIGEIVSFDYLS